jgi:hypothetical protein
VQDKDYGRGKTEVNVAIEKCSFVFLKLAFLRVFDIPNMPSSKHKSNLHELHINISCTYFPLGPNMGDELDAFLALFSRETRENVICLRELILEVCPNVAEQVDLKAEIITYRSSKESSDGFDLAIAPHMKHLNLLFNHGALLFDPSGLLAGTGALSRHIKIRSEAETQNPALQMLLKEALKLKEKK